jgi:hypothetical protein
MEYIDRVDVCHSESAFGMTGSDTVTALQKNQKQPLLQFGNVPNLKGFRYYYNLKTL